MDSDNKREIILSCKNVFKAFGGTQALKDAQLNVVKGEVHALLGENGAGKSTLMKIIIGLHKADKGTIMYNGKPYSTSGPADAQQQGISMIHQELTPEPYLTVAESIFLNKEDTYGKSPFLNKKKTNQRAEKIMREFGLELDAKTLIEELTVAQMQLIEIIRAVSFDASLIIMDEPTSSLDSHETKRLFDTIKNLKAQGKSIVYISHRMEEIFEICDYVSVFRDGNFVDSMAIGDVTNLELISMMVGKETATPNDETPEDGKNILIGRSVDVIFPKTEHPIGDVVFEAKNISGIGFNNISFCIKAGEILGISGLVGSGRSETMLAIFGMAPLYGGEIFLNGKKISIKNPTDAIDKGICMVNEDRKNFGLCLIRSIKENVSLPTLKTKQRGILLNKKKETAEVNEIAKRLTVKTISNELDAYSLSGGNQQKVVLAKWLMASPKLLILDEPTRGVDVGAKAEIYAIMGELASKGMAVIMVSSELPEVMNMSDRILIYHEGKLNGEIMREQILDGTETQKTILAREFGQ